MTKEVVSTAILPISCGSDALQMQDAPRQPLYAAGYYEEETGG